METEAAIKALAALSQETRLGIFRALVRAHDPRPGTGGLPAGAIAEALEVGPTTLSFHLKELANASLVSSRREGRSIVYSADLETMRALTGFLLEDCCQGACGTMAAAAACDPCP